MLARKVHFNVPRCEYIQGKMKRGESCGIGLAIGVAFGMIFGMMLDALGLGIALGAAFGLIFGGMFPHYEKPVENE